VSVERSLLAGVASALSLMGSLAELTGGPRRILASLGWDLPPGVDDIGLAALDLGTVGERLTRWSALALDPSASEDEESLALLELADAVVAVLFDLGDARFEAPQDYLDRTGIEDEFLTRLLDLYLIQSSAAVSQPAFDVAVMLGWFELQPHEADPQRFQVAHVRHVVHWDRVPMLFTEPEGLLREVYGWGTPEFDAGTLVARLGACLQHVSTQVERRELPAAPLARLHGGPPPDHPPQTQLFLTLLAGSGLLTGEAGITLFGLPPTTQGGSDGGLGLGPYAEGGAALRIPLSSTLSVGLEAGAELGTGLALVLRPDTEPLLRTGLNESDAASAAAGARVRIDLTRAAPAESSIALLATDGARVEAQAVGVAVEVTVDGRGTDAVVRFDVRGGRVIATGEGSSFLAAVLPAGGASATGDFALSWSHRDGVRLNGRVDLETEVAVGLSLGPLTIDAVDLRLALDDRVALTAGIGVTLRLAAALIVVDGIGLRAAITPGPGSLGSADLTISGTRPTRLGFALDTGVVRGGGFIGYDSERDEYAGVLELAIGPVSVKAIAVLTTRLPDGRPGWALLLLVFSEFEAIQLGYGFTLNGVGGVIGMHHGVSTAELQAGLRSGALDSVLFPPDPIATAPQILGRVRLLFPIVPRALTIGPAAKIGWGTPAIVKIDLGLVVQIDDVLGAGSAQPQISRVVLVGRLEVKLPPEAGGDVPELLKLLVDVVGSYEVRERALSIDARLRDSHVAGLPLAGSLVVRARFGDAPSLILAVGGFHPRFTELPPGLPAQERIGFELRHDIVTVRVSGYVAVTSNTFQVGADAELSAAGGSFKIQAALGFDALFEFEPVFHFEIDFRVNASIRWRGRSLASVKVTGVLRGPGRWEVSGHASFSILWWDVSIGFELGWGDVAAPVLATVAVGAQLVEALSDPANWAAELPVGGEALVTLRKPQGDGVPAHPLGALAIMQNVVPLGIEIARVGTARPSDGSRFDLARVVIAGRDVEAPEVRSEHFARGRYLDLDPEERLSTPSFERFRAGVAISSDAFRVAADQVAFEPEFETVYLGELPPPPETAVVGATILVAHAYFGSASQSSLRRDARLLPDDLDTSLAVVEPAFVTLDGGLAGGSAFGSFTEASEQARRDRTVVAEVAELVPS
jgi:hypothetical protein